MEYFKLNIPCLENTLKGLETAIQDMEQLKNYANSAHATLLSDGWSGSAAMSFSGNSETWSRQFLNYRHALQSLHDILKNTVLTEAGRLNEQALNFTKCFDGSPGTGTENQLTLLSAGKEEACRTAKLLIADYDTYRSRLQSVGFDDAQLHTSFSISPELRRTLETSAANQNMLYDFEKNLNLYEDDLQTLDHYAAERFQDIKGPGEWTVFDELNSIMLISLPRPANTFEETARLRKLTIPQELYDRMVQKNSQGQVIGYNWDFIDPLIQSDPNTWGDQALFNYQALTMIFESMAKPEDIEHFINSSYRVMFHGDSKEEQDIRKQIVKSRRDPLTPMDSFYLLNKNYVPAASPILTGMKNYYRNLCMGLPETVIYGQPYSSDTYQRVRLEMGKMALLENICLYGDYLEASSSDGAIPKIQIRRQGIVDGDFLIKIPARYAGEKQTEISVFTFRNGSELDSVVHDLSRSALDGMTYGPVDFAADTTLTVLGIAAPASVAVTSSFVGYVKGTAGSIETSDATTAIKVDLTLVDYAKALEMNMVVSKVNGKTLTVHQASIDVGALENKLKFYNSKEFDIAQYRENLITSLDMAEDEFKDLKIGEDKFTVSGIVNGLNNIDRYSIERLKILIKITQGYNPDER